MDRFLQAALEAQGLGLAPEADRRTLLRRVSFDLTGLPPSPAELTAFAADPDPLAYERAVDRLLASPAHGERWARHWMDAAHFAETHGHDQDRIRTNAWPWRDYLIRSFNADKPYPRFIQEQLAGDVLFPGDPQATLGLGFLAAGPWDESSLRDIREDTLDRQIARYVDRDDMSATVMSVVAGSTVHCARCHDHKFDPVPQADYYALQAVFAGVDRADRAWDPEPAVHRRRQELLALRRRVDRAEPDLLLGVESRRRVARWESDRAAEARRVVWNPVAPTSFVSVGGATLTRLPDHSFLASGARPERDTYTLTLPLPRGRLTGIRLEVLPDESLPKGGPGRNPENGNFHLSEFQAQLFVPGGDRPQPLAVAEPTADHDQEGWTIRHALDGNEKTAWGIHPQEGRPHQAILPLQEPLTAPAGATLSLILKQLHGEGHLIGRFRISLTGAAGPLRVTPAAIEALSRVPAESRTTDQRLQLAAYVWREEIRRELAKLGPGRRVYAAAADFEPDGGLRPVLRPRPVQVLRRGEITQPTTTAEPGALRCVSALPARFALPEHVEEGGRRAALARWLTDPAHPLTWRTIVNRVWHHHFGRGLVDTPNDLGRMGGQPSHPELLDWLAVWFRDDARGSLKALHRLLVTSAAYRRASAATPADLAADPDNVRLGRMNRLRLDAESIRDAILQVTGRLDPRMGGPSDRQFDLQPGIHVTPRVDYGKFDVDSPAGARRSVYRFHFRTLPDPFMDSLDCPAGDQLTGARLNSVTVQQALALWNNAFVVRQAAHFAARLEREGRDLDARVDRAAEAVWGRPPAPAEHAELAAYARRHGLANLARLLFNSNEFVFVE
ncbi:MAG: DUF1549 and DUF1553 domain-containing protein [Verrucomicrobiota bacterium]